MFYCKKAIKNNSQQKTIQDLQTCIPNKSFNLKKINELMELLIIVVATSNETEND